MHVLFNIYLKCHHQADFGIIPDKYLCDFFVLLLEISNFVLYLLSNRQTQYRANFWADDKTIKTILLLTSLKIRQVLNWCDKQLSKNVQLKGVTDYLKFLFNLYDLCLQAIPCFCVRMGHLPTISSYKKYDSIYYKTTGN